MPTIEVQDCVDIPLRVVQRGCRDVLERGVVGEGRDGDLDVGIELHDGEREARLHGLGRRRHQRVVDIPLRQPHLFAYGDVISRLDKVDQQVPLECLDSDAWDSARG